jgi:hypothetical protein
MFAKKKMTEKELAAEIQRHRGDTSTWSKRSIPAEERKQESAVVFSVRFTPNELDGIRRQADALGVTVASIIRHAVVEHSAMQTAVFDFSGAGSWPKMVLLGGSCESVATGYKMHNVGFPDYLVKGLVIPGLAYNNLLPFEDDDEPKTHHWPPIIAQ